MRCLNQINAMILASSLLFANLSSRGQGPFILVEKSNDFGGPNHAIFVIRADPSALEKFAGDEFVDYISRASEQGVRLMRGSFNATTDFRGPIMLLGVAGKAPFADIDPAKLPPNGFRIRSSQKKLEIIANPLRTLEPSPYIVPLWPREEHSWLWYRSWDNQNSSEVMTQGIIDQWEKGK